VVGAPRSRDEPVGLLLQREVAGDVGGRQPGLTGDVDDPPQDRPTLALEGEPRVLDGLGVGLRGDAPHDRGVGRERQLGIPDALCGQVAPDAQGEGVHVVGGAHEVDDREVDLDEVREVGEDEVVRQGLRVGRHRGRALVPRGELGDDRGGGRADLVHVQLGLGQAGDEVGEVGSRERSTGHGSPR